jgi:hypothetical protein
MVLEGRISLREASDRMQISYRHAKRLKHVVARSCARWTEGVVHGNRGRRPANAIGLVLKQRIEALSRTEYASFNDTHFTEKFLIVEGIRISWETVRSIRRRAEILPKRRRRPRRHRFRRAPKSQEGMMVFCEGSAHRGFGAQHPSCCLIVPLMMGLPGGW